MDTTDFICCLEPSRREKKFAAISEHLRCVEKILKGDKKRKAISPNRRASLDWLKRHLKERVLPRYTA